MEPKTTQTAWVVERYNGDTIVYFDLGVSGTYQQCVTWTSKHENAMRFARKQDAERILFMMCDGIGRAVEHMWTS